MAVILVCDDCGSGYRLGQLRQYTDDNGAKMYQCPNCYAPVGQTRQANDESTGVSFGRPMPSM